jgi:hypothetical protein
MSVCIVAKYPWREVEQVAVGQPSGVIVCNDTRLTMGGRPATAVVLPKQLAVARNLVVCYTSSNLSATSLAFAESLHTRDLRKVGKALRDAHQHWRGATELLGIVWRRRRDPQILELMSPNYQPKRRSGILGIGDPGALNWFQANFAPLFRPPLPASVIESLQLAPDNPSNSRPPFDINDAALHIAIALDEAIASGGGPTVGLPIQVLIFTASGIRHQGVSKSPGDGSSWMTISADPSALDFPNLKPTKAPLDTSHRTARQLFS